MEMWRVPTGLATAGALSLGICFRARMELEVWLLLGCAGGLWLTLVVPRSRGLSRPAAIGLGILLAGSAAGALRTVLPCSLPSREACRVAGRLLSWNPEPGSLSIRLLVHQVDELRVAPPLIATVRAPITWGETPASNWLRVQGRLEAARGGTVPGGWVDPTVSGSLLADRHSLPEWGPGRAGAVYRLRTGIVSLIDARLHGFSRRFAEAIFLGRSRALTPEENSLFRRTGTSHVVAVSGMHITLLAGIAGLFLSGAPRHVRWAGAAMAAAGYASLAGGSPSVVRAAVLALGVAAGTISERPRTPPAWAAVALPWLLWLSPEFLVSVSFLLSLGAVCGILLVLDVGGSLFHGRGRLVAPLVVSLGAQWATLPVLASVFGTVSPLSILPNLLAVPLSGFFLPAILFAILGAGVGWIGNPFFDVADGLARALLAWLELTGGLPLWSGLPRPGPLPGVLTVGLLAVWFSLPRTQRRRRSFRWAALGGMLLAGVASFLTPGPPQGPWVVFLDVGQGDSAVMRLSDGSIWVVDVGDDRGPSDAARRALLPFLRNRRVRRVDGLIISHRHRDHVGALASFLEGIPVERVFDAGVGPAGGTSGVVDSLLAAHRRWPCLVAAGDTLHHSSTSAVLAVHPERGIVTAQGLAADRNLNDASLVVWVRDRDQTLLFAGDVESEAEAACAAGAIPLSATVLKAPHHGSRTSSTEAFRRAAAPRWVVVSVGEGNRFRHPDPGILARYREDGARLMRTDLDGSVEFRWGDGPLRVRRYPPGARVGGP